MGHAIAVRTDYTADEVRRVAKRAKDAAQARRLLAIAAVLDGASREAAAKIGGMDRQTLRDWVIRFNEQGPDGLVNIPSPGVPPKLDDTHKAFLARIVEEGPIPAVHGVVRWRACDLIMRLYEEFGISVSDDTVYRALKDLGFSHVSARPKAYKQNTDAMEAFKKTFPPAWHGAKALKVPSNLSLMPLPPRAPELNGQENIWQFMRQNWLSNRVFKSFDDIVDHCCYAWNTLIDQPWKIMSIARRDWASVGYSM